MQAFIGVLEPFHSVMRGWKEEERVKRRRGKEGQGEFRRKEGEKRKKEENIGRIEERKETDLWGECRKGIEGSLRGKNMVE